MIKAIIFDIGGVIADDVWEHLIQDDLITKTLKLDQKAVETIGEKLWEKYAHRKATTQSDWRDLEKEYWNEFVNELKIPLPLNQFIEITNKYIRPVNGMPELLDQLNSKGLKLGICSNNTEFWFERQWLNLNLYAYFEPSRVVLSSRIGVSKSSPNLEMFQAALIAFKLGKNQCLFVDDRELNIQRAIEYGLTSILFPTHIEQPALYLKALLSKMGVL